MSLFAAAFVGGMTVWLINYMEDKKTEKDLTQMYYDKYGAQWDEKIYPQGVVQNALGYGESPTLYYNEAETLKPVGEGLKGAQRNKIVIDRSDVEYYFNFRMGDQTGDLKTSQNIPMCFTVSYDNQGSFDFKVGEVAGVINLVEDTNFYYSSNRTHMNYSPDGWKWVETLRTPAYVLEHNNMEFTPHLPASPNTMWRGARVFNEHETIPEGGARLNERQTESMDIYLRNPSNKEEVKFFTVYFRDRADYYYDDPDFDRYDFRSKELMVEIRDMLGERMFLSPLPTFNAESEVVSGKKRGKVISMIGSDPRLRKLTKDKDITPEEAVTRLEISAEHMSQPEIYWWEPTNKYGDEAHVGVEFEDKKYAGRIGRQVFEVEFDDWAEQEMKTHGYDISFREWADEESGSHGDEELLDWAQHEEESHEARYGAEGDSLWEQWQQAWMQNYNLEVGEDIVNAIYAAVRQSPIPGDRNMTVYGPYGDYINGSNPISWYMQLSPDQLKNLLTKPYVKEIWMDSMVAHPASAVMNAESYKPPASAVSNAKRGLSLRKEFGRGGLSPSEAKAQGIDSGVTRARKIASGKVSRHDVRRMSAFNRHRKNNNPSKKMPDGGPTAGTIAWLLWGGTSGVNWAKNKSASMNAEGKYGYLPGTYNGYKLEKKQAVSYFTNDQPEYPTGNWVVEGYNIYLITTRRRQRRSDGSPGYGEVVGESRSIIDARGEGLTEELAYEDYHQKARNDLYELYPPDSAVMNAESEIVVVPECLFCENDDTDEPLVEVLLDGYPELICESCMDPNNWAAESFGPVDEDGILAKALAKARAKSKEPRRPLKITKLPHRNQKSLKDFEEFNSAIVYRKPEGIVAQVMAKEKALQQLALSEALLELEQYIRLGMITEEEAFRKIVQMSQ